MDSTQKLILQLQNLSKQLEELFAKLDKVGDKIYKKPDEKSWSVMQVLVHLYRAEFQSFFYITKKLSEPLKNKKTGFMNAFKSFLLKIVLKMPFKYKAPKVVENVEYEGDYESLKTEWRELHQNYILMIKNNKPEYLELEIFKHPIFGKINLSQTFSFFKDHFEHHLSQIDRNLK